MTLVLVDPNGDPDHPDPDTHRITHDPKQDVMDPQLLHDIMHQGFGNELLRIETGIRSRSSVSSDFLALAFLFAVPPAVVVIVCSF
jgi:hypothetical protein